MAYQFSRKGCFKVREPCSSDQRLCYNCRQPGHESSACPSPRTVSAKQSCGGVGHIQAECPSLRIQQQAGGGGGQKCYNCGRFGHIARVCPSNSLGGPAFASRPPPPGRALNTSTLPPVQVDCLAAAERPWIPPCQRVPAAMNKTKTCYKCQQEGPQCPENADFMG
ncbi:hypothetical protein DFH06DRAFT_1184175 [Mycena polygramma]|nr:hypothetical protein DFH06DRAFT_1184175 [Mycena polygramma]